MVTFIIFDLELVLFKNTCLDSFKVVGFMNSFKGVKLWVVKKDNTKPQSELIQLW